MEADRRSVQNLCERALEGEDLTRDELVLLLGVGDVESLEYLRQAAEEGLRRWCGTSVDILFRVPISSFCEHNCLYCDLRRGNHDAERFRLPRDQIAEVVDDLRRLELGTLVLDGAQDPGLDVEFMGNVLDDLAGQDLETVVLSLGERERSYYEHLRERGAQRYILNHKTASPILYNELHPEGDYFDRLQCIQSLLDLQYRVGTTVTVGLPHQDLWDLTDDFLQVRELGLETVIVGPFAPGAQSPLAESPRGSVQRTLNAIAVARLALRGRCIPGGVSFRSLDPGGGVEALRWGANAVICDLAGVLQDAAGRRRDVRPMCDRMTARIHSLGRQVSSHPA